MPSPKIQDRRQIWIQGGLSKNENDNTDYKNIKYAITFGEEIKEEHFKLIRKYNSLSVFERQL